MLGAWVAMSATFTAILMATGTYVFLNAEETLADLF
jgi:hypothetical protein